MMFSMASRPQAVQGVQRNAGTLVGVNPLVDAFVTSDGLSIDFEVQGDLSRVPILSALFNGNNG
jgi:hypothetical protein